MLTIVATPIGNLKDITLRALEVLKDVDAIICEDSRRTSILLNHYQIQKPMMVLNDFNEANLIPQILQKLISGQNLALVSDAGTPLISDPGYKLVRECILSEITVDSLPGPTAAITALTLSGLPPDKFLFLGYLPEKPGHRKNILNNLVHPEGGIRWHLEITVIIYVAPHKLIRTLEDMKEVFGNIEIVLTSELTKIHQNIDKKNISDWLEDLKAPRGEYTLLFKLSEKE